MLWGGGLQNYPIPGHHVTLPKLVIKTEKPFIDNKFTGWPRLKSLITVFTIISHEVIHIIVTASSSATHVLALGVEFECRLGWLPLLGLRSVRLLLLELC